MRRLLLCAALVGCAPRGQATKTTSTSPSGPGTVDAARRIAATLRDDDPRHGYDLLAGDVRERVSYDNFAARWRASSAERGQRAAAIEKTLREGDQVGARAELTLESGPRTTLVRERDGWRLETPLVASLDAQSPSDTLRLFARALDERSLPELLRVLTASRREDVRRALERFQTGLRAHLGDALDVTGDRAVLSWHDGEHRYRVMLRRENGEWRIDDFSAD